MSFEFGVQSFGYGNVKNPSTKIQKSNLKFQTLGLLRPARPAGGFVFWNLEFHNKKSPGGKLLPGPINQPKI
jgi:hypothetical protein